jgi:hypothetical protein
MQRRNDHQPERSAHVEWTFHPDGPVWAEIDVAAGEAILDPSPDGTVRVVLEPLSRHAGRLVESYEVRLEDGGRLVVRPPSRSFGRGEVRCAVTLPEGSALTFRTASADLHCNAVLATFDGSTASGDVHLPAVIGDASLNAASGDFDCGEVGGRLSVKAASSDVRLRRLGSEGRVSLASGDLEIEDLAASLKASTASGDVRVRCARSGRIQVDTASGDVAVGVAPGVGAYLDVTSVAGEMECDLPLESQRPGDSQLEIICRTVSGDVRIEAAAR